ncbi:MAG: methyltransferase [Myxococcales bacterium]|nr:methyltransferase [Myxococcales bacterium]
MPVRVYVGPLPDWLDHERLLGPGFVIEAVEPGWVRATASLERPQAADAQARLRGIGIGGRTIDLNVSPRLNRKLVRAARTDEAKRRRNASVGFTRKGARLDDEGKISLTPESLALETGKRVGGCTVVDACCGAGGNAIGFARAGNRVVALEVDQARIKMAAHNARLYGIESEIEWRCADAIKELPSCRADLLFVDPPWGADYDRTRVVLADLPFLEAVLQHAHRFSRTLVKLPPSFDVSELPHARPEAVFGTGEGDSQRVKFLLLEISSGIDSLGVGAE